MLGQIFSAIGGGIGKSFGGGIFSTIGRWGGRLLGNYLERRWHKKQVFNKYINLKEGFRISTADYGAPIPLVFGKSRCYGSIIWADEVKEIELTATCKRYFAGSKQVKSINNNIEIKYFLSFAMAICEGPIIEISRVWNGDDTVDLSEYKCRIYTGGEEQEPDPLIASRNEGKAPAFRDLAYIVFEELPLADFDDTIPNLSFEITRKANITNSVRVEDLVKSMIMIPGSGEYVYDTKIQTKTLKTPEGVKLKTIPINCHNFYNIANSIHSLNQLKQTCSNVEWVSPVVCWFGTSVNAGECLIMPAIEFRDRQVEYSEEWKVAGYNRADAYQISKDENQNPIYGGSVNDASVIRYLKELKNRGLKVMFYPMFFLDVDKKPWRGRVTGNEEEIRRFFRREKGYNNFILHYANKVKDLVDAFVIGSELIGLTKVSSNGIFPAVEELINLAATVKKIVGSNVQVTYAADWSEYHHTDGGWFNLDPLWASPNIDFVGIDAYFPVTGSSLSVITPEEIAKGWMSGEGYDYYVDYSTNQKHALAPEYAWKNLRYWWENTHINPDGKASPWRPKSKSIWFTEFGFPSIDKATNQPNVFFDPFCLDGGAPRHSSGEVDFTIQRRAIKAFIQYWQEEEYIGRMFLWTWDARPYPAWPHMDIWRDGYLWQKGHWVNDKFGACGLAAIIAEISQRCYIDLSRIETMTIDEAAEGLVFSRQLTALDAINMLRSAYFFDLVACRGNIISFVKRGGNIPLDINSLKLIKISKNSFLDIVDIPSELIISKIHLTYINQQQDYSINHYNLSRETNSCRATMKANLPIIFSPSEAERICFLMLNNAENEKSVIKFKLPITEINFIPTDFIIINFKRSEYQIRIIATKIKGLNIEYIGIIDEVATYRKSITGKETADISYKTPLDIDFAILDLPIKFNDLNDTHFSVYLNSDSRQKLFFSFESDISRGWSDISYLNPSNAIAKIIVFEDPIDANPFLTDKRGKIIILGRNLENHISDDWQWALAGKEIIRFKNLQKIGDDTYEISILTRGEGATESFIGKHQPGEEFIFLGIGRNIIEVSKDIIGQPLVLRVGKEVTRRFTFNNNSARPLPPYIIENKLENNKLKLKWIERTSDLDGWRFASTSRNIEYLIKITSQTAVTEFICTKTYLEIDLSVIILSDDYKVDIFTKILN